MKIKDPALFEKINVFFTEYLPVVRRESPNTITAYRYTINIYFECLGYTPNKIMGGNFD